MVERTGVEPVTSSMPLKRATNCANAPYGIAYHNTTFLGKGDWLEISKENCLYERMAVDGCRDC